MACNSVVRDCEADECFVCSSGLESSRGDDDLEEEMLVITCAGCGSITLCNTD